MSVRVLLPVLLVCLGSLLCYQSVDAVKCYECNSVTSKNCLDPFNSQGISDNICALGNSCSKFKATSNGESVVLRGCSGITVAKDECKSGTQSGQTGEVCVCLTNDCNGASTIYIAWLTVPLLIASIIASLFMI